MVQELLCLNTGEKVQELPGITPEKLATRKRRMEAYAVKLASGSFNEVLARAVLYVVCAFLDRRLYSSSVGVLGLGAAVKNLSHRASRNVASAWLIPRHSGTAHLGAAGGGTAAGAYYAPTSYIGNPTMCGRYPYPPCKVRTR